MNNAPTFLFMDETEYLPLDIAALTGILVPISQYNDIRDTIAQLIIEVISPPLNTIPGPIELHGSDLLPHLPQDDCSNLLRIKIFDRCVEILNENDIYIFRVCYTNYKEILSHINDEKLYSLNFFGMQSILQPVFEERLVIPVMDGVPNIPKQSGSPNISRRLIESFASHIHYNHHCYQFNIYRRSMSIKNSQNLTEVLFASSQFSNLIQLADLTSYLFLIRDQFELSTNNHKGEYKNSIYEISKKINPELIVNCRQKLEIG